MKILHVNFSLRGGAGIAAQRISEALNKQHISSQIAHFQPYFKKHSGITWIEKKFNGFQNIVLQRWIGNSSINLFPTRLLRKINRSDADIVHLHWINAEMLSIAQVSKINKPVVWTCHDMWPFCGAEHYTSSSRYIDGYSKVSDVRCQVSGNGSTDNLQSTTNSWRPLIDLDRRTFRRKQKHWKNCQPYIVTPSRWLGDCVRNSFLMGHLSVTTIPNCLDLETFKPLNKTQCRKKLNLPLDKKLVLFGAFNPHDERKGGDLLEQALQKLESKESSALVVFGCLDGSQISGMETRWIGNIDSQDAMAELYNAADVMCVPSRQDNLPNTVVESLACGTAVVAFDVGGLSDMIDHQQNGYLAKPYDTVDLAKGIEWVLHNADPDSLSRNARRKAETCFAPDIVASKYMEVYEKVIGF